MLTALIGVYGFCIPRPQSTDMGPYLPSSSPLNQNLLTQKSYQTITHCFNVCLLQQFIYIQCKSPEVGVPAGLSFLRTKISLKAPSHLRPQTPTCLVSILITILVKTSTDIAFKDHSEGTYILVYDKCFIQNISLMPWI